MTEPFNKDSESESEDVENSDREDDDSMDARKAKRVVDGQWQDFELRTKKKNDMNIPPTAKEKELLKKVKEVEGHGTPFQLYTLISELTPEQKKDIENIGFGGLLMIKASGFYHQMSDWLLSNYDSFAQMFRHNKPFSFPITKEDVYDVFMLPCTNNTVDTTMQNEELVKSWKDRCNLPPKAELKLKQLRPEILRQEKGGDDFKKLFVLYAMGSFLVPKVHRKADYRLCTIIENVTGICQLDWCGYVLSELNKSVGLWKPKRGDSCGGCLMLLRIIYFHRLRWQGKDTKTDLPLVLHWTLENMKKRILEEVKAYSLNGGKFGVGVWDLSIYPVSRNKLKCFFRILTQEADPTNIEIEGARTVTYPPPADILTDAELVEKYPNESERKWITAKRDIEVLSRVLSTMTLHIESVDKTSEADVVLADDTVEGQHTQDMRNPSYRKEFFALCESLDKFNKRTVDIEPP